MLKPKVHSSSTSLKNKEKKQQLLQNVCTQDIVFYHQFHLHFRFATHSRNVATGKLNVSEEVNDKNR